MNGNESERQPVQKTHIQELRDWIVGVLAKAEGKRLRSQKARESYVRSLVSRGVVDSAEIVSSEGKWSLTISRLSSEVCRRVGEAISAKNKQTHRKAS